MIAVSFARHPESGRPQLLAPFEAVLGPGEGTRAGSRARRVQRIVSRALLRTALSSQVARDPRTWRFRRGTHGRLELDDPAELRFSLAHGAGLSMCAVAVGLEVGVDVEHIGQSFDVRDVEHVALSPRERASMHALPPARRWHRFLSLFVLKEAYVKAVGVGLSLPIDRVEFDLDEGAIGFAISPELDRASRWRFSFCDPTPEYRAAVAVAAV